MRVFADQSLKALKAIFRKCLPASPALYFRCVCGPYCRSGLLCCEHRPYSEDTNDGGFEIPPIVGMTKP